MKKLLAVLLCLAMAVAMTGCCVFHQWENATCEDPQTCSKCGEIKGNPLDHEWEAAACETPETCASCDKTRGEALGHDCQWELAGEDNMAGTCSRCGKTITQPLDWAIMGPNLLTGSWKIESSFINNITSLNPPETKLTFTPDGKAQGILLGAQVSYTWEYVETEEDVIWFSLYENGEQSFIVALMKEDPNVMNIVANNGHLVMTRVTGKI